jgi:hypothetical protein
VGLVRGQKGQTMKTWYAKKSAGRGQGLVIEEDTGRTVAVTYEKKDAPLVAAAPELLVALKALLPILDNDGALPRAYDDIGDLARAAVAKAEGGAS